MARYRQKDNKIKKMTDKMRLWAIIVFCLVLCGFIYVAIHMFLGLNEDGERYLRSALSQQTYNYSTLPFKRGDILDRNGMVLAESVKYYNLILDPVIIKEKDTYLEPTLTALEKGFNIPREDARKVIEDNSESRYVIQLKNLTYEQVTAYQEMLQSEEFKSLVDYVKGVWFEDKYIRTYPLKSLASATIGFTFDGDQGNNGIEGFYNEQLNGIIGSRYGYLDSDRSIDRVLNPAVDGNNIVTTLDVNIQSIIEKQIKNFNQTIGAKNVAVLIGNPRNGEIYAMASTNSYDLNNPRDLTPFYTKEEINTLQAEKKELDALNAIWRNYMVSDSYEPGSTFKPFTVGAAIEEALSSTETTYFCDGGEDIFGSHISCANKRGHGLITLSQAIALSCNDALMQIVAKMGKSVFHDYLDTFNIGSRTGIDLPGEEPGISFKEEQLGPTELATSSFGQSIQTTMVQMFAGFSSTINGGYYYTPHVVKQIASPNGAIIKSMDDNLVKRTVSEMTSEMLRSYLYEGVENGTAKPAQIPGYTIGGKTGTAQKYPRTDERFLVSFIGFAPVEDPEVVVYVIVDEANEEKVEKQADSKIATRLAHDIMKEVFPFLGIYPSKEGTVTNPPVNPPTTNDNTPGTTTDTENTDTENTDTENNDTENTDTENTDTEDADTEDDSLEDDGIIFDDEEDGSEEDDTESIDEDNQTADEEDTTENTEEE